MKTTKIKAFTDLITWKKAHSLVLETYDITNNFPKSEAFALTNQMRRCAVSVSSNIAEGFSRKSKKEKQQFYYMSLGSITELQNQLIIAKDIGYLDKKRFDVSLEMTDEVHRLINSLIKSSQNHT